MSDPRGGIVFAGGGTGGHLYPSLAIAERLRERDAQLEMLFMCSNRPIDRQVLNRAEQRFVTLPVVGLPRNPFKLPGFLYRFKKSQWSARQHLRSEGVGCVVAMGGFVSGPVVFAARRLGIPVVMVNLDAIAGKANRKLAPMCGKVLSVYENAGLGVGTEPIGFPVRRAALASNESRSSLRSEPGLTLLVTGASSGALSINEAMIELARRGELEGWRIIHLTGEGKNVPVAAAYKQAGVDAEVLPYLDEMGRAWGEADVAISRAGAGSVGEAVANGVPAVFLPYPYHRDRHQRLNAAPYEQAEAAVVLEDRVDPRANADQLAKLLRRYRDEPARLTAMRDRLAPFAAADGAGSVAEAVLSVLESH